MLRIPSTEHTSTRAPAEQPSPSSSSFQEHAISVIDTRSSPISFDSPLPTALMPSSPPLSHPPRFTLTNPNSNPYKEAIWALIGETSDEELAPSPRMGYPRYSLEIYKVPFEKE